MDNFKKFISESIDKDAVHAVLHHPTSYLSSYTDHEGKKFTGVSVNDLPREMRDKGHKAGRAYKDASDLKSAGFKIRKGAYNQGARPTGKQVDVVHVYDHGSPEHAKHLKALHDYHAEKLKHVDKSDTFSHSIHHGAVERAKQTHKEIFGKSL